MFLLFLMAVAFEWGAGQAQPPAAGLQLGTVTVTGARRYTEADVTRLSALKPGQPVTTSDLDAAVKRMAGTGLFASVKSVPVTSGNRLNVTLEIEEPAWTMPVMLDNFIWLSDDELRAAVLQQVPTFDGTLADQRRSHHLHDRRAAADHRRTQHSGTRRVRAAQQPDDREEPVPLQRERHRSPRLCHACHWRGRDPGGPASGGRLRADAPRLLPALRDGGRQRRAPEHVSPEGILGRRVS